jgi:hypothetical protein
MDSVRESDQMKALDTNEALHFVKLKLSSYVTPVGVDYVPRMEL